MPKKRIRKRSVSPLLPFAVLAVAILAACALLNPRHQHGHNAKPPVAFSTPLQSSATEIPVSTPVPVATASLLPTALPTVMPQPTFSPSATGAKLAIIIDDCGQWISTERCFVALPIPLTLSVLPDVPYAATIQREAADAGKGVMLHLPMETISGLNPGPGKVTTEMSDSAIAAQVDRDLAQVSLAQGVNNHEGSKASADERVMHVVAQTLAEHGHLFFVDSRTTGKSVAEQAAEEAGLPAAARDVFLDNREDVAYTEQQLREAAAIAKRTGSAIAIGHPRPTTLEAVRAMIPQLQAEGISFVLVRSLTH